MCSGWIRMEIRAPRSGQNQGRPGALILTFIACYAVGRFFLEFFRGDADRLSWGPFSTSQWLSAAMLLLAFLLCHLPATHRSPARTNGSQTRARGTHAAENLRQPPTPIFGSAVKMKK